MDSVRDDDESAIKILRKILLDHLSREEVLAWDADMIIKDIDAMLACPGVGTITEDAMAIHGHGVVPNDACASLTTIHLDGAKRPIVVLVDWMEGTNSDGTVVPAKIIPERHAPVTV